MIDWTWFIPGTALPALVCAGWLAGRGPLEEAGGSPRFRAPSPAAIFGLTGVAAIVLATAWLIGQPLRSENADAAALTAATKGQLGTAIADARTAAGDDPMSVDPLFELAAFKRANGDDPGALGELRKAVDLQPDNAMTWLQEGELLLGLHRPAEALPALTKAAQLDLGSTAAASAIARARAELGQATPTGS
jgi:tetratricopeptide (TPR) repeat protein